MEQNKTRKYLKYAFGEIILVVIGILIALQVNNWNKLDNDKKLEKRILTELHNALDLDILDLNSNINYSNTAINSISILLDHLGENGAYNDSLDVHFGNSTIITNFISNTSVFENLKTSGLNIISNDTLRLNIITYYDYYLGYIQSTEQELVNPHHNMSVRPIMLKNFDYSWVLQPAKPYDYKSLIKNQEYLSILKTTKEITLYKRTRSNLLLEKALDLQRAIEKELDPMNHYMEKGEK